MKDECILHHRIQGKGVEEGAVSIVILHGLFGSMDNLAPVARKLSDSYRVISVDLRNHGRSLHSAQMSYPLMADDVLNLMEHLAISQAIVLGHSMGGKVAMQLALQAPEKVRALVLGDIAPVDYAHSHEDVLNAIKGYQPELAESRSEADAQLARFIENAAVRQLLIKGLQRDAIGHFVWRLNAPALVDNYDAIRAAPELGASGYTGPVLFVKGGESDYLKASHKTTIDRYFPNATLKVVTGAGHWLHAEKPDLFNGIVERFLSDL